MDEDSDPGTYEEVEDESDWESYDEPDEEEEEEENILESIPRNNEGVAATLHEVPTGGTSTGASGIIQADSLLGGDDDGDMMYSQRTPEIGIDEEEESSDEEEENSEDDYPVDPFDEIGQQISRIGKLTIRSRLIILCANMPFFLGRIHLDRPMGTMGGHVHGESVSNPLLSQPRRNQQRPITLHIGRGGGQGLHRPDGISAITQMVDGASEDPRSGSGALINDVLDHFSSVLGADGIMNNSDELGFHDIESLLRRDFGFHNRGRRSEDAFNSVQRVPTISTNGRWQEAALMFGVFNRAEISGRVIDAIYNRMVPYTRDQKDKLDKVEKETFKLEQELEDLREERERKRREKREEEEKKRREEETAAREAEERQREQESAEAEEDADMENADESGSHDNNAESGERSIVNIGGRDVDVTGMGIDPEFLEALPADIREEAFTQHLREMQSSRNQAGSGAASNREIAPEFLDALPDSIRQELLAQEALENRGRRQSRGGDDDDDHDDDHGAVDMDLASFLATLDPGLRQTLLLEQDDISLSSLPPDIAEEARQLRNRTVANFTGAGEEGSGNAGGGPLFRTIRRGDIRREFFPPFSGDDDDDDTEEGASTSAYIDMTPAATKKPSKKHVAAAAMHLVDKAGVAALVRLLYLPQHRHQLGYLNDLLVSLCSNKQNRLDILNMVLHVLQDGSGDRQSLEKGFAQTSNRAKPGFSSSGKGGTPAKNLGSSAKNSTTDNYVLSQEISPVTVMQQAIETLEALVANSGNVKYFFVSEHEHPVGMKKSKYKGKGKEKEREIPKEYKYPINLLLTMLDRPAIRDNNTTMELFSALLHEVTRSLPTMLKTQGDITKDESTTGDGAGSKDKMEDEPPTAGEGGHDEEMTGLSQSGKKVNAPSSKPKRTHKLIDPPYIPEYNLGRISHIIAAKECSGKTFQQILSVMQFLSAMPGIKSFFGNELLQSAMALGPVIIADLKELLENVRTAEKGSDLQGAALAKFSSGSADQAKLLRILTAIDYLFDTSRGNDEKPEEYSDAKRDDGAAYLKSLYESMTFGPLWGSLSDCLLLIQDRQDMIHVATALLPLIESLMVICKHSRVKEVQLRDQVKYEAKKNDIANEPLESLFFSFTDEHRKILNQIIRNNPQLMIGSFSILVKNPKSLEFDNKRKYFYRRIYPPSDQPSQTVSLSVRRDQVFLDSYKALYFKSADEIKRSRLNVRFQGEEGVDAGGVTREWFQVLSRQIFNPDYALFSPVASDRTTFHPNRTSWVNPEHLSFFKFIGRIIGKAIYDLRVLDCHFSRAVYKKILGKAVSIKDMETLDLDYYKSLVWMLENDITDIITETFSIEAEDYGEQKVIDLKPGGRDIPVTEENKREYVNLVVDYRLLRSVEDQMAHFLEGKCQLDFFFFFWLDIILTKT